MVFEVKLAPEISALRYGLASWGVATQIVLWVGLATSMIYVVSGIAQYAMGRRIIDRYPLKATYIVASALQIGAMLALGFSTRYAGLDAMFAMLKQLPNNPIIQVNHPRFRSVALFDNTGWDGVAWPPPFPLTFDAVEVLAAWCELRRDFRHFRLDRISAATALPDRMPRRRRVLLADWRAAMEFGAAADRI